MHPKIIQAIGSVIALIGAFLPWYRVGVYSTGPDTIYTGNLVNIRYNLAIGNFDSFIILAICGLLIAGNFVEVSRKSNRGRRRKKRTNLRYIPLMIGMVSLIAFTGVLYYIYVAKLPGFVADIEWPITGGPFIGMGSIALLAGSALFILGTILRLLRQSKKTTTEKSLPLQQEVKTIEDKSSELS